MQHDQSDVIIREAPDTEVIEVPIRNLYLDQRMFVDGWGIVDDKEVVITLGKAPTLGIYGLRIAIYGTNALSQPEKVLILGTSKADLVTAALVIKRLQIYTNLMAIDDFAGLWLECQGQNYDELDAKLKDIMLAQIQLGAATDRDLLAQRVHRHFPTRATFLKIFFANISIHSLQAIFYRNQAVFRQFTKALIDDMVHWATER